MDVWVCALKGQKHWSSDHYNCFCPFRAQVSTAITPRALPWANGFIPFQGNHANCGKYTIWTTLDLLVSGEFYLFILENTNCTNNTNRRSRKSILAGCYLAYRIQIARIPSGWHSCYSPLIKKYSSRMEIRVIRAIRVLLNIEILVFGGWISIRGLVWVQQTIKQRVICIYRTPIILYITSSSPPPVSKISPPNFQLFNKESLPLP